MVYGQTSNSIPELSIMKYLQRGRIEIVLQDGTSKSYLAPTESSRTVYGTDLQRNKARIIIVLCVNGDGSHFVPVQYIDHSAK